MPNFRGLGREAEDRAADYLILKGLTIVTRRYGGRGGEIDLVALDGEEIVFVEVKLRQHAASHAEEAVGPKKKLFLRRAADKYLMETGGLDRPHRFDIIAMDTREIRHHQRVFLD